MHRRFPRALILSSFAVGGLLMAAPAHAAETSEVPATIVNVSMQDGELTARIRWTAESKSLPSEVEVLSYDGTDKPTAGERLSPKAGEEVEVKLSGAVREPWETGWAQRLVVREAQGRELASQPYDVSLACEDEKTCQLTATPGISASREVLHLSTGLQQTLGAIEKEMGTKQFDLVREVARREPSLYGEALTYAHGLVKVGPAEGCQCSWTTTYARSNTQGTSRGAAHNLYAGPLRQTVASNNRLSTQGSSRVTLNLHCTSLASILSQELGIRQPGGLVKPVRMLQPVYSTCAGTCSGRFSHFGRITGRATARTTPVYPPPPMTILNATAMEQSKYHLGNALSPLLSETRYAPLDGSFDVRTTEDDVGSGSGYVQTSGEAFYAYNGDPNTWQPYGHAQGNYAIAVQGVAVCPGGGLNPIGRAFDIQSTYALEQGVETLDRSVQVFFGM